MGMRQSLGLFMQPVTHDLGITAADYAFALAVQNIVWGFSQPVAGAMVDRFGTRWIAVAGGAIYAAEIGRAHVCTPVTNAHLVCRLLLEKQKLNNTSTSIRSLY